MKVNGKHAVWRIENLWKDEVARVGARKASVVSTLFKMIRDRFLIAMTLCILFNTLSIVRSVTIRARGGLLSLSCQKILHRQNSNISVGELVTLCANDGQRVYDALRMSVHIFGGLPPIIGAVYSVYLLGPWGLFGYVIFFGFFPIQVCYNT
ncbi:hypothetical protein EB796_013938 [Bugula neritina]|uniref:Uncharacterized protein n=1 Tax=Bugula neritina TaxID=10212 RepID=A0A7J7JN45_BUGNE|nr:hypothetical protein EB796_013938 [Bugula neritina]